MRVALIDSGGSNLGSVRHALERLGAEVVATGDASTIRACERVILPGVGVAAAAMQRLQEQNLVEVIRSLRQPLLGICLGMQILFESSEEGGGETLGLLRGRIVRLPQAPGIRIPHMGWNRLVSQRASHLLDGIDAGARCYFVHSFAAPVTEDCVARSLHGVPLAALVQRGNIIGAQFHPERSGKVGARFLENFLHGAAA